MSLIWLSVDTAAIQTIEDLKKLIVNRINATGIEDVHLFCQDCYLPPGETIAVVRDEDLIRINFSHRHTPAQTENESYCSCFSWPIETKCQKKRKASSSCDGKASCSEKEIKRKKREISEFINNMFPKKNKKRKKSKDKNSSNKSDLECSELDVESNLGYTCKATTSLNSDYSLMNVVKKRKKRHEQKVKFSEVGSEIKPVKEKKIASSSIINLNSSLVDRKKRKHAEQDTESELVEESDDTLSFEMDCSGSPVENGCKISTSLNSDSSVMNIEKKRKKKHKHKVKSFETNSEPEPIKNSLSNCNSSAVNRKKRKHFELNSESEIAEESSNTLSSSEMELNSSVKNTEKKMKIDIKENTTHCKVDTKCTNKADAKFTSSKINSQMDSGVASSNKTFVISPSAIPPTLTGENDKNSSSNNCKKKRKRNRKRKSKTNKVFAQNSSSDFKEPNKMDVSIESSNTTYIEHSSSLSINKHIKFDNKEEKNHLGSSPSDEETATIQNIPNILSSRDEELQFGKSSPVHSTSKDISFSSKNEESFFRSERNGMLGELNAGKQYSPEKKGNEKPGNNSNLSNVIQSRYMEISKNQQLASVNTNISSIYTNTIKNETCNGGRETNLSPEKKDYKLYSVLKGPPRTGDLIAYKSLELSADYCPQMSDYKEGRVISYNVETDDFEVELTSTNQITRSKGKFDLPIENDVISEDGSLNKNIVFVNWAAMVEPRLIC